MTTPHIPALTLEDLQPYLQPNPLPRDQAGLAAAWVPVVDALLQARYGHAITAESLPVFASAAATAIQRRLDKPNSMVSTQSVNGASIGYARTLLAWFAPSEVSELDAFAGIGGIRTHPMAGPPMA